MSRRVLVGETDPGHFELLNELLAGFGFEVVWVKNWDESLRWISEKDFDLVLVDAIMAGTSGLKLIPEVKKDLPNPPAVVIMSAAPEKLEEEIGVGAHQLGIDGFLEKPVTAESLESVLISLFPLMPMGEESSLLKGNLATLSFPELIMLLYSARRTGVLRLTHESVSKVIYFERGYPIYGTSNKPSESLGRYLVSQGLIELKEYQAVLEEMLHSGKNQTTVLISRGSLSPHQLFEVMNDLAKWKILGVFAWDHGDFVFRECELELDRSLFTSQNPVVLTREGIHQFWDTRRIRAYLGNRWRTPLIRRDDKDMSGIALNPRELKVWRMLDDKTSLDMLLDLLDMDRDEIAQIGFFFVAAGIVDFGAEMMVLDSQTSFEDVISDEKKIELQAYAKKVNQVFGVLDELNYFQLLGVSEEAHGEEIREAYNRATLEIRPYELYVHMDDVTKAKADAIFRALTEAYETLMSDELRRSYIDDLEREEIVMEVREASQNAEPVGYELVGQEMEADLVEEVEGLSLESLRITEDAGSLLKSELKYQEAEDLLSAGNYKESVEALREAIALNPTESEYHALLAWALFMTDPEDAGVTKEAISSIGEALKLNPSSEEAYFVRGKIALERGQRGEAIKCFQLALRFNPQHDRAKEELKKLGFRFR